MPGACLLCLSCWCLQDPAAHGCFQLLSAGPGMGTVVRLLPDMLAAFAGSGVPTGPQDPSLFKGRGAAAGASGQQMDASGAGAAGHMTMPMAVSQVRLDRYAMVNNSEMANAGSDDPGLCHELSRWRCCMLLILQTHTSKCTQASALLAAM